MLVLIIDAAFQTPSEEESLSFIWPHVVVFANAFMTMHHANVLVVVAASQSSASIVYPDPQKLLSAAPPRASNTSNPHSSSAMAELDAAARSGSSCLPIERVHCASLASDLHAGMGAFVAATSDEPGYASDADRDAASGTGNWALSGALSSALCRISRTLEVRPNIKPRILVLSAHPDVSTQYVAVMNAIFSAQKLAVAVDACVLHPEHSLLLQQAAHLTGGVYVKPELGTYGALAQYLLTSFLADAYTRVHLAVPLLSTIDYRATCFCHRKIISIGYVCSSCLSIFCSFAPKCSTCGTTFDIPRDKAPSKRRRRRKKKQPKRIAPPPTAPPAAPPSSSAPVSTSAPMSTSAPVSTSTSASATTSSNVKSMDIE